MKFRAPSSVPARLQTAEGVQPLPPLQAARRPLWLLGADLCVFTVLDMRKVPARLRVRAIAERARQLSPFAATGWHATDSDGAMALWCWDEARVRAAISAENGARDWEVLPEQLFLAPADDACLRVSGGTGVLERWRDGRLVFSAALPADGTARALWLRAAGLPIETEPPRMAAGHAPRRWDRRRADWRTLAREPLAAACAALGLVALWLLWSAGTLAGWQYANQRLERRMDTLQAELAPVLEQREEAARLAARTQALAELLGQVTALEAAAEFEHLAGGRYDRLLSWEFNGRSLRATLEDDAPDNRAYVESLQRSPWFERVSITPTPRPEQIGIEVTLSAERTQTPVYLASAGSGEE
jgi:hypothetical protein